MGISERSAAGRAETLRKLRALGTELGTEAVALRRQITELQVLLRQTAGELDRLTPQSSQANQRLRDMEAHLDSYSRADIKNVYSLAHEAQMRIFMMQLQQEQIDNKLRVMTASHEIMARVAALADQVESEPDDVSSQLHSDQVPVSTQELLARVIEAQEEERRRLSRQMHDGPAQALANLVLRAEICERLVTTNQEAARQDLADLKKLVVNSLQETRHFIFELRPMILDDLGLAPTLRRYTELLAETCQVPIRLTVTGMERRVSGPTEIALFRVAQEAVRNALRHAEPKSVHLTLEMDTATIRVTIRDNGRGCDQEAAIAGGRSGRNVGLARMEELARSVGGYFDLESKIGEGTAVTVSVPIAVQADRLA